MENAAVVKMLKELVAIDSQSQNGNKKIIDLLEKVFAKYPCTKQSWERKDGVTGENLTVKVPGKNSEQQLVFVGHTDTVPTSSAWETDPFALQEKDGKVFGLGTCDTKGGIASLIQAVLTLSEKPNFDTYLLFDGDEESEETGARKFLENNALKNPHFIFIEPTDRQLHIAQRAIFKFDVTTHGIATHGSFGVPERNKQENAINKMSEVLDVLIQDAETLAKETHAYLPSNTQNLGVLHGGTARNVFADHAILQVDRRLLPSIAVEKEIDRLQKLLAKIPGTTVTLDGIGPGFSLQENNPFVQKLLSFYQSIDTSAKLGAFQAWSEAGLFQDSGDVVILGPGSLSQAHKANEFVAIAEVEKFVEIYRKIIEEITFSL